MRTALTEEFQCGLWKMVATALVLAMRWRLRPDRNTALIGCARISVASLPPTPPSKTTSTEGDTMSRNRKFHPVPRGGIDPIRSADDALAVLALRAVRRRHDRDPARRRTPRFVDHGGHRHRRSRRALRRDRGVRVSHRRARRTDRGDDRGLEPARRRRRTRRRPPVAGGRRSVPLGRHRAGRMVRPRSIGTAVPASCSAIPNGGRHDVRPSRRSRGRRR